MANFWHHPDIDPVLFRIPGTPLAVRWYSLLYVGGFLVGRWILRRISKEKRFLFTASDVEQLVVWFLVSAVVGARIVYCIFYDWQSTVSDPWYLFQVYRGGLSFHGAMLGLIVTALIYSRRRKIPFWNLGDGMALATPAGLAMGRLGNFINGELFGRVSHVPWAMIFKDGGSEPRHPSQLYEMFLEGVVLMVFLYWVKKRFVKDGSIAVAFLLGYAVCRFVVEFFREPDPQVGYLALHLTMGQWLSVFMFVVSALVGFFVLRKREPSKKRR